MGAGTSPGPRDAMDRVTVERALVRDLVLSDPRVLARDLILPETALEQYVSVLQRWLPGVRKRISQSLVYRHRRLPIPPDGCPADDLHWELGAEGYPPERDSVRHQLFGDTWTGSLWHRDEEIITLSADQVCEGVVFEGVRSTLLCRSAGFYPIFDQLADHLLDQLHGQHISPIDLRDALPASVQDFTRMEVLLRTDPDSFYAWFRDEVARSAAWLETDVLGFYQHISPRSPSTGHMVAAWTYVQERWHDGWKSPEEMVTWHVFLTAGATEEGDLTRVAVRCLDARVRAPRLRMLARALQEFPADGSSTELAAQYVEWADLVQRLRPVKTMSTPVQDVEREKVVASADALDEEPQRVHLVASVQEYLVWLTCETTEEGLLSEYRVVKWERLHILLQAQTKISLDFADWSEADPDTLSRPEYVASLVLARPDGGQAGIIVTARPLCGSHTVLRDFYRMMRASVSEFSGTVLPCSRRPVRETSAGAASEDAPLPAQARPQSDETGKIQDAVWLDARLYASILKRDLRLSDAEIAARSNRRDQKRHKPHDKERVRYVRNKMREVFGDHWWDMILPESLE